MRHINITANFSPNAYSSVLYEAGNTKILCTASLTDQTPSWLDSNEQGWLTAEYSMLPGSTGRRKQRARLKPDSRSTEIERLIGRSLRAGINLKLIPGYAIYLDCDVINADGSTRCNSINAGYIALALLTRRALKEGRIGQEPLLPNIAAVSMGLDQQKNILSDLDYKADSTAVCDINIVMNKKLDLIEIQGTAERGEFSKTQLINILDKAEIEISGIIREQNRVLGLL